MANLHLPSLARSEMAGWPFCVQGWQEGVSMGTEWMSAADVVEVYGISRSHVYGLVNRDAIPHARFDGKLIFNRADLDTWVRAPRLPTREVKPAAMPVESGKRGANRKPGSARDLWT
jgi:predicted DNA-binding transcriptional regulator AlpA